MKQKKIYLIREYTVLAVLFLFSMAALFGSVQIFHESTNQDNPGMFPIFVCCGMLISCVAAFFGVRKSAAEERSAPEGQQTEAASAPDGQQPVSGQETRGWAAVRLAAAAEVPFPVFVMIAATILYGAVLKMAGFYPSTGIYMLFSILFLERGKHVIRSLIVTAGWLVFVYLLIQMVFQIRLP